MITRGDSGSTEFNFSEVFGSAIAAGISTYSYHPHAERTIANTASVWATEIGYDTISYDFQGVLAGYSQKGLSPKAGRGSFALI